MEVANVSRARVDRNVLCFSKRLELQSVPEAERVIAWLRTEDSFWRRLIGRRQQRLWVTSFQVRPAVLLELLQLISK